MCRVVAGFAVGIDAVAGGLATALGVASAGRTGTDACRGGSVTIAVRPPAMNVPNAR